MLVFGLLKVKTTLGTQQNEAVTYNNVAVTYNNVLVTV